VGLLFAGDVLGASPVLRAEADDEVEEDRLAQQEPESDEDTDQQDDEESCATYRSIIFRP